MLPAPSLLLALETSTLAGSVALAADGRVVASAALSPARRRTGELLPAIRGLYAEAGRAPRETTVVAFSAGPGSFTGLRTGATIARMIRLAAGADVVAVSSLAATAAGVLDLTDTPNQWMLLPEPPPADDVRIGVLVDARGGLYFGAHYEVVSNAGRAGEIPLTSRLALRIIDPPATRSLVKWKELFSPPIVLTGEAMERCGAEFEGPGVWLAPAEHRLPTARVIAEIGIRMAAAGRFSSANEIVPTYIRPPECEEVFEQRRDAARQRRAENDAAASGA